MSSCVSVLVNDDIDVRLEHDQVMGDVSHGAAAGGKTGRATTVVSVVGGEGGEEGVDGRRESVSEPNEATLSGATLSGLTVSVCGLYGAVGAGSGSM